MRNNDRFPLTAAALVIGVLLIGSFAASAECDPSTAWESFPKLPMGLSPVHVWIDGVPAPVGTYITFSGENVRDSGYMALTRDGGQQKWSGIEPTLMVQGQRSVDGCGALNIPYEAPITFYIDGIPAKVRIYRNVDCGTWYFVNSDKSWQDTLTFVDGATYEIELCIGNPDVQFVPEVPTGPCETWDVNHMKWAPEDQYWLDHWRSGPKTHEYCECRDGVATCEMQTEEQWIADWFAGLGTAWYIPGYSHDQTEEPYQRMVFYADHGGYGCTPNLTAMVDAQGWYNMYTSYGWPYKIGHFGWSRVGIEEPYNKKLPSLYLPPLDDPVLVKNGYQPSLDYVAENPPRPVTQTPEPTPLPTSTPMPLPPYADHSDLGEASPTVEPTDEPTPEPTIEATIEPEPPVLMKASYVATEVVEPTTIPTTLPTPVPTPAPPISLPHQAFTGDVTMPKIPMSVSCASITLGGNSAPAGTVVTVTGTNVYSGSSVTLENAGAWDDNNPLVIQGTPVKGQGQYAVPEGSPLLFSTSGIPLKVRVFGTTTWQDFIPYSSGSAVTVELASVGGASPSLKEEVTTVTPTLTITTTRYSSYAISDTPPAPPTLPIPTPTQSVLPQVTSEPTATPTPKPVLQGSDIKPFSQSSEQGFTPPDNVLISFDDYPKENCFPYAIHAPEGFGVLRVSAGNSESLFYVNGALVVNGGNQVLNGMRPGFYRISYRQRYFEPVDFDVEVMAGKMTNVEVFPEGPGLGGILGWPIDWSRNTEPVLTENIWPEYREVDRTSTTGSFIIGTWFKGTTVYIDDRVISGCQIPCDFKVDNLDPGLHWVKYECAGYESEFPVIILAGYETIVYGGSPIGGYSGSLLSNSCSKTLVYTYDPVSTDLYRGVCSPPPQYVSASGSYTSFEGEQDTAWSTTPPSYVMISLYNAYLSRRCAVV